MGKYTGPRMVNRETFIDKSKWHHGDKYDYSKVQYVNKETKVCIICPTHGEFWQRPGSHSQGKGCNSCKYVLHSKQLSSPTSKIIEKFIEVHGDRYDYSKVDHKSFSDKVEIICKEHGSFLQSPGNHINGQNCPKCGLESRIALRSSNTEEFVIKAQEVHGYFYNYDLVEYVRNSLKVKIVCPVHGAFLQIPDSHISGRGCDACGRERTTASHWYDKEIFISKAKQVHGERYCYDDVNYKSSVEKVSIKCKSHGHFMTAPAQHLQGQGCPHCANLRKGFGRSALYRNLNEYSNIYLIRLYNNEEDFIKVGLARKPNVRHARLSRDSDYEVEVLRCYSEKGRSVYDLEKSILQNKEFIKYVPKQQFQGYTECFSLESLEDIDELLEVCFEL